MTLDIVLLCCDIFQGSQGQNGFCAFLSIIISSCGICMQSSCLAGSVSQRDLQAVTVLGTSGEQSGNSEEHIRNLAWAEQPDSNIGRSLVIWKIKERFDNIFRIGPKFKNVFFGKRIYSVF